MQVQAFSGPTTDDVPMRAWQPDKSSFSSLVQLASGSNEPGDGGGRSKISGLVRQCNFRWWPRRSALQVSDFDAAGRRHGPLSSVHRETSTLVRFVQFARASSVPADRNSRNIGKGVKGFKLVMVSSIATSTHLRHLFLRCRATLAAWPSPMTRVIPARVNNRALCSSRRRWIAD